MTSATGSTFSNRLAAPAVIRIGYDRFAQARDALGRAFFDYPLMVYAVPDVDRRPAAVRALYGAILRDALRHGEVHATRDMAGVACWLPPARAMLTLMRQARCGMLRLPLAFGGSGFRRLLAYDAAAARLHHEYAPHPHWYLAAIGVVPDRQGQGLAAALVRPMLARACAESVACYLETQHNRNVRIYERLGFRVVCQMQPPGHPIPVWAMKHEPK